EDYRDFTLTGWSIVTPFLAYEAVQPIVVPMETRRVVREHFAPRDFVLDDVARAQLDAPGVLARYERPRVAPGAPTAASIAGIIDALRDPRRAADVVVGAAARHRAALELRAADATMPGGGAPGVLCGAPTRAPSPTPTPASDVRVVEATRRSD